MDNAVSAQMCIMLLRGLYSALMVHTLGRIKIKVAICSFFNAMRLLSDLHKQLCALSIHGNNQSHACEVSLKLNNR